MAEECHGVRLTIFDEPFPYIVPVNFGYKQDNSLTLYIHGVCQGKKVQLLGENSKTAVEMYCRCRLIEAGTVAEIIKIVLSSYTCKEHIHPNKM
ncbi:hypothetical protein LI951_12115 [Enterococcus sp. BWT-B8]|nr:MULTISPECIES: hypothetical protein [unclassified Enterococcus]MCB5952814.1 hypothetical protein [Enterococcus sp. BWT-B8]MCB5953819.1 hypothetical protein [Enterococcus sp. CWB-B31]